MSGPPSRDGYLLSTLERLPPIDAGDVVECARCGEDHVVQGGRRPFVICSDGATRVAGVAGRCVLGLRPDAEQ